MAREKMWDSLTKIDMRLPFTKATKCDSTGIFISSNVVISLSDEDSFIVVHTPL